jgi:hypothetical protein
MGRTNRLLSLIRHGHIENDASDTFSTVACVLVTAVTYLPSRCLATIGGILTESLPNKYRGGHTCARTHAHRQQRELMSLLYFPKYGECAKKGSVFHDSLYM